MRRLNPEEAALWAKVAATISPLAGESAPLHPATAPSPAPSARKRAPVLATRPRGVGSTLDASWDRKLRAGQVAPDRTIDLHGMTLNRAWQAIDDALDRAISGGDRILLLITGHDRPGEPPVARGKIRAAVHDWLAASRHAPAIAAVRGAHRRHGGPGSLYLILRRR